jgi:glutamate 5-kinase
MKNKERWVIKAGSSLVTSRDNSFNQFFIADLASQLDKLIKSGVEVMPSLQ